ncbi:MULTISPECIES: hypothetical protein [unclassified Streptomyces]|uniref:hypothetical protein n=1 Tax=unclassified Streptomyces TaxID=2593676 RepID=UPI0038306C1A
MDASWWPGVAVVVALALVAALVDGRGRSGRPPRKARGRLGRGRRADGVRPRELPPGPEGCGQEADDRRPGAG